MDSPPIITLLAFGQWMEGHIGYPQTEALRAYLVLFQCGQIFGQGVGIEENSKGEVGRDILSLSPSLSALRGPEEGIPGSGALVSDLGGGTKPLGLRYLPLPGKTIRSLVHF